MKYKTLKELAVAIIDREIVGNQDQFIADYFGGKEKLTDEERFEKTLTAIKNFDQLIRSIMRDRHVKQHYVKLEKETEIKEVN